MSLNSDLELHEYANILMGFYFYERDMRPTVVMCSCEISCLL